MSSLLPTGGMMSHATPCFEYRFEFTRFHLFFFWDDRDIFSPIGQG